MPIHTICFESGEMMPRFLHKNTSESEEFALVEVMIAVIILFIVLVSAKRALFPGMANTSNDISTTTVESQILGDIRAIQGIDARLSAANNKACDHTIGGS